MRFAVVIECAGPNYCGYIPDIPGCAATGTSTAQVRERLAEAVAFHFEGLREDGIALPRPSTEVAYVQVPEWREK